MTKDEPGSAPATGIDRLASLGRISGELLHDMANLIAVVKGRASLAQGDARAGRLPTGELDRLVDAADELGTMLRDVMEVLAGRTLSPEVVFDPRAVAERTIERFLDSAPPVRIRLSTSISPRCRVGGRATFLSRVISNLLNNAARHARAEIEISLVETEIEGEAVLLMCVEDDGRGLDAREVEQAFRPLVSGVPGRTGLGLSSVMWAVAQLGGEVSYRRSRSLGGACFEIRLPVLRAMARIESSAPASLMGTRLLFLEDDDAVREAMSRLLERMGAETVSLPLVWHGEEDLIGSVLRSRPDVILMDLRLGARSGLEIWKQLQSHLPTLAQRVVFVSGLAPGHPEWDAATKTGQPVLPKPLDLQEIARTIEDMTCDGTA